MSDLRFPVWLRRSIEAAILGAVVAIAALIGERLSAGGGDYALPTGALGALLLAPPVLALGVLTCAYPVAMAGTRSDALFGAIAAFLIAADATTIVAGGRVSMVNPAVDMPAGLFAALLAAVPAVVGLVAGQAAVPVGFGRRAGAWTAAGAAIAVVAMLGFVAALS